MLSYSNSDIATIRPDNSFIRPKWGIYRSLNDVGNLRDEAVRFSDFSIAEVSDLNINSNSNAEIFATFPNPIFDKLALSDEIVQQFDSLQLFDITGKLLLKKNKLSNEIDVSFLNTGLYFIQFSNNQQRTACIKIIKK